jgi:hypothetical protein
MHKLLENEPNSVRIDLALQTIDAYGSCDGAHHKQWVLDQVVKILAPDYDQWVRSHNSGEEGPNKYSWDTGIAP